MPKSNWQFNPSGVMVLGNEGVLAFRQTGPAEHCRGDEHFKPNPVVGKSWGPTTYARLMIGLRVGRSFAKRTKQRLGFPLSIQEIKDQLAGLNLLRSSETPFGYTLIPQIGSYTPIKYKGVPAGKIPKKELLKFTEPSAQVLLYMEDGESLGEFFNRTNLIGTMLLRTLDQEKIIVEMVAGGRMICTGAWSAEDGDVKMGPRSRIDFAKEARKAGLKV